MIITVLGACGVDFLVVILNGIVYSGMITWKTRWKGGGMLSKLRKIWGFWGWNFLYGAIF